MSAICNHCINKEQCSTCDKSWLDKFVPNHDVEKYFKYFGRGEYRFDTTNKDLIKTHSMRIGCYYYCPYCGEIMQVIQDPSTYEVIGHCCICEGARSEIEYEEHVEALKKKHEAELRELRLQYRDKLTFCVDKLLEIKHKHEKEMVNFHGNNYSHFSTLNGKQYYTMDRIVE